MLKNGNGNGNGNNINLTINNLNPAELSKNRNILEKNNLKININNLKDNIEIIKSNSNNNNNDNNFNLNETLLEISNLVSDNNKLRFKLEDDNNKKRKLEKFLFHNCDHDFKFAYREPHERATYICIKCNCYDDKYYYQN